MQRTYQVFNSMMLQPQAGLAQPTQTLPLRVSFEDQATTVMTDFKQVSAVLIRPGDVIDEANQRMIQRGVRLLLVVDENRNVVGIITATDILGEKPLQAVSARGVRREELEVRDVMTPQRSLDVLNMVDVAHAKVGHVVATLKKAGRQHALVVDIDNARRQTVRGLFSATQIARQLGVSIATSEVAHTFAEIEALLAH